MRYRDLIIVGIFCVLATVVLNVAEYSSSIMAMGTANGTVETIIIDAGHGGEDGGAIGVDGVVEKNLNLPIALEVAKQLKKQGLSVVLTRDGDYATYSEEAKTLGQKKTSDIHNRFALIEDTKNCIFVSIHMNHYDSEYCSGAQTFYSDNNEDSAVLAQKIQNAIREEIQHDNERQIKPATSSIYLLYYAEVPAVLVECGFISNIEESKKLQDPEYQNKIAKSISNGILDYLGKTEENSTSDKIDADLNSGTGNIEKSINSKTESGLFNRISEYIKSIF